MAKKKSTKPTPEKQLENYLKSLADDFARWEMYYNKGGSDPNYTDGENMMLIRNHIIYDKRKAEELCTQFGIERPEILDKPLPPEVDRQYMAQKNEILAQAQEVLQNAENNEDYLYLQSVKDYLFSKHKKIAENVNLLNVLNSVKWLKDAIARRDYLAMRCKSKGILSFEMEVFKNCAEKVKAELEKLETQKVNGFSITENNQLSLFD